MGSGNRDPKVPSSKDAKDGAGKKESSGTNSLINIFLLYSTLVGLGAIGGYMAFYALFNHRCADLLDEAERHHNETRQGLQDRYVKAVEEHHRCLEDESKVLELFDLRDRLGGQADLAGKHESLLDKHHESVERLSNMRAQHDETIQKYNQLKGDVEQKQTELTQVKQETESYNEQKELLGRQLADQKELMTNRIKKKTLEIKRLNFEQKECIEEGVSITKHIQRRHGFLCQDKYGAGPYHVQFHLKLQEGSDIFSFVVEIASRKQLPHSVYTFLSLVESNLLDGTSFFSTNEGTIRIGAKKESASALDQKYKAFGFEESVLTFIEESSIFPCGPYSMGFVGLGPALEVFTSEEASNSNRVCFGRVVRGMQTLSQVEDSLGQGEGIDIVEIRHLLGDEKSRDEL